MRDVQLEARLRALPGVSTCTVGPESVVVVAARGADAAAVEKLVLAQPDLDGRSLQVLGGVRMASGRRREKGSVLHELGPVMAVAGAAALAVSLVVGPSSARLLGSVTPGPASDVRLAELASSSSPVLHSVAHRRPPVVSPVDDLRLAALPITGVPARRRPAPLIPAAGRTATPAPTVAEVVQSVAERAVVVTPVSPATVTTATSARHTKNKKRAGATTATTSTGTARFSIASFGSTPLTKQEAKAQKKAAAKADREAERSARR